MTGAEKARTEKPTSPIAGVFIVANAALGVGTLNFPQAFAKSGGIYVGIAVLAICGCLCGLSLSICAFANFETKTVDYYRAVRFYCGPALEFSCHLVIVISNVGTCVAYMTSVGDQSDEILYRVLGEEVYCERWYLQRRLTISLLSTLFILPLCLAKNIDFLKYPSGLGVLSMLYLMLVIVLDYFASDSDTPQVHTETVPEDFANIFDAFPTILLGYQCMSNAYPVFGAMREPTLKDYSVCIVGTVFLNTLVYLPVAVFGYLKNGVNVNSNVLLSYDSSDNKILIAQVAVLIAVLVSYPTMYLVAKESIDKMWKSGRTCFNSDYHEKRGHRVLIALTFFLVTLGLALGIPDIGVAISFTGSVATYPYLILPGLMLIQSTYLTGDLQFTYSSGKKQKKSTVTFSDNIDSQNELDIDDYNPFVSENKEEHEATRSHVESYRGQSSFMRNKYKDGTLSWFLRAVGLLLCVLGAFVAGLGFMEAIYDLGESEVSTDQC